MRQVKQWMQPRHDLLKATFFAITAFFCMAVLGILTKFSFEHGGPIWVSFITYVAASLLVTAFLLPQGITALKSQHYTLLIARAVTGTIASFLYMLSMRYISIVNSTLLFNTAPIFIPLLSMLFLKKSIKFKIWQAVILGFIGIIVIIKPNTNLFTDPGNLIGLASGIFLAIAYLIMKILTDTETGLRIIFFYFCIGMLIQIPLLYFPQELPALDSCLYAGCGGLMLFLAQLALVKAYTYAEASEVGVYQYSSVVFVALLNWLFWSNTPDLLDCIGFILVTVAGIIIIHDGAKK
jgi:drug/metabolite transporter (DMT)-like permease